MEWSSATSLPANQYAATSFFYSIRDIRCRLAFVFPTPGTVVQTPKRKHNAGPPEIGTVCWARTRSRRPNRAPPHELTSMRLHSPPSRHSLARFSVRRTHVAAVSILLLLHLRSITEVCPELSRAYLNPSGDLYMHLACTFGALSSHAVVVFLMRDCRGPPV